jgi:hypothetical protein
MRGTRVNYVIDCRKAKLMKSDIMNSLNVSGITLLYNNYVNFSAGLYPEKINIMDLKNDIQIEIRIKKLEVPWIGKIVFIPGKNYEILPLP